MATLASHKAGGFVNAGSANSGIGVLAACCRIAASLSVMGASIGESLSRVRDRAPVRDRLEVAIP